MIGRFTLMASSFQTNRRFWVNLLVVQVLIQFLAPQGVVSRGGVCTFGTHVVSYVAVLGMRCSVVRRLGQPTASSVRSFIVLSPKNWPNKKSLRGARKAQNLHWDKIMHESSVDANMLIMSAWWSLKI